MADQRVTNLARREDIGSDVLRQRRDLYAISIALTVFNLAGGHLLDSGSLTYILPARVEHPGVFIAAAWVGFLYFLTRYWLMAPPAWSQFFEEVKWQAGATRTVRNIAKELIDVSDLDNPRLVPHQRQEIENRIQSDKAILDYGYVPIISFKNRLTPKLSLNSMRRNADDRPKSARQINHDLLSAHKPAFWLAMGRGMIRALYRERSFSDYVMPYLIATITIAVGVWRLVRYVQLNVEMMEALSQLS